MLVALVDLTVFCILTLLAILLYRSRKSRYGRLPFPPGPKGFPIIGNLLDMPKGQEWVVYREWTKEYGPICHMDILGKHVFVVNSAEIATELFEKRSSIYSDRPTFIAAKLLQLDWPIVIMQYGKHWRAVRKVFHEHFHPAAVMQYEPQEMKATHNLLRKLRETPDQFMAHLRHLAGETILSIAYGIDIKPIGDPYVEAAETTLHAFVSGTSGGTLFDFIPWLEKFPHWFPGASFKKEIQEFKSKDISMVEDPYRFVKQGLANGDAPASVAAATTTSTSDEFLAKHASANMYFGGTDTTVSALATFLLAMILHPEIQRKAQDELETVIGSDRLPTLSDQRSLPYIDALMKEVLRWRLVTPLGVAHRVAADDAYDGYFIPAGSTIIPNVYAMSYDESVFPNPDTFDPEHFLDKSILYPNVLFGFGRRICPGRFLALSSMWLAIASILATFDVSKAKDENGNDIEPVDYYTSGMVSYPVPFKCEIKPRSTVASALIKSSQLP